MSEEETLEPSEQGVLHSENRKLANRICIVWTSEAKQGKAADPPKDTLRAVLDCKWDWAERWSDRETVTDANIIGTVRGLWPNDPAPDQEPV